MTVYTEDTIPSASEVVIVWFLGLPIPLTSSIYSEEEPLAVAHVECEVPSTAHVECQVPAGAYTEDTI